VRRPFAGTLLAVLVLLSACSGSPGTGPGASGGDPSGVSPSPTTPQPAVSSPKPCADRTERPFSLAMKDFKFVPTCLVVSGTVPFHLHNGGSVEHNFTIPGTKFSVDVGPGKTVGQGQLMAAGVPPGTYTFYCRFHRNKGMTGQIHVLAA
jgi:plastocyanin